MQIEVEVKGQRIKRINSPGSVEDTLNYLTCHFTFDGSEWENTIKTAYFKNRATEKIYSSLIADDGTCTVPWESLTDKGYVEFSAAGERENYRITTGIESFYNSKTVYGGEPSEPPTPDQYDQLIALAQETKEIAESVREDADAGEFDGEPGKPGDPGKDGVSPSAKVDQTDDGAVITVTDATGTTTAALKNGKDGDPGQNATDEQVQAAVDAYMEEHPIQADSDDIIKLAIKNEASGAVPIVVTDSADMGVQDLEMRGWTKQAQYEGKNLFDISAVVLQHDGDTVHVTPENPETSILQSALPGQYTISFRDHKIIEHSPSGDVWTCNFVFYYTDGSKGEMYTYAGTKFTSDAKKTVSSIALRNPRKVVEDISGIMINAGAEPLSYEPYTGGKPSPNPDYKQDVKNAGKYDEETQKWKYEVKLTGKNLWDKTNAADKNKWVPSTSQTGYSDFAIDVATGQSITVSFPEKLPTGLRYYVGIALEENGSIKQWMYHSGVEYLIHQQATVTAVGEKIWIRCNSGRITDFVSENPLFQIEHGLQRTEYAPYQDQTVTLTSDRPLTKWDRLEKRDGVWGWAYKSNIVDDISTLIPDDTVIYGQSGGRYFSISKRSLGDVAFNYDARKAMSEAGVHSSLKDVDYQLGVHLDGFIVGVSDDDTIETAKEHMHYKTLYEVISETFVPLSETEQEALNTLHTYYPTTTVSNDAGCDMSLTYIADTKAYIDSKIAAIQAAVANRI